MFYLWKWVLVLLTISLFWLKTSSSFSILCESVFSYNLCFLLLPCSAPVSPAFNPNHPRCSSFILISLTLNLASVFLLCRWIVLESLSCLFHRFLLHPQPFCLVFGLNKKKKLIFILLLEPPVSAYTWAQQ